MPILNSLTNIVSPLADKHYVQVAGIVTGLMLLTLPFELWITPLARKFRIDNPYINYPIAPEHVPVALLAFLSVMLPLGFITFAGVLDRKVQKHAAISILGLLLSLTSAMFIADVFKFLIGNQRPDFIARCQPRADAPKHEYVSVLDVCTTQDLAFLWEGCRSTPSGHSALSFAGLGFLAIWIVLSFDLLRADRPKYLKLGGFTPFLVSGYVAYTRIIDHKHHWVDIISGSLLGTVSAYGSYRYVVRDSKPERSQEFSNV